MNALVSVDVIILQMIMFVQIVNWVIVNQNRFGSKLENLLNTKNNENESMSTMHGSVTDVI